MRALTVTDFGAPDKLAVVETPTPAPNRDEITIDVSHAAVGLIDVILRRGDYRERDGLPRPPYVPGLEVAGTVRAVGDDVTTLAVGESVATVTLPGQRGLAEVVSAPASLTFSLEGLNISPEQAAAGLGNAATAFIALSEAAHLQPRDRVLVHGVTGALASTVPPVARMLGASHIVGTVRSTSREDAARSLGVDAVVVSDDVPAVLAGQGFDIVVDPVGGRLRRETLPLMVRGGRMLVMGNASGAAGVTVDTNDVWLSGIGVIGFNVGGLYGLHPELAAEAARNVLPLLASGELRLPVTVLPLDDAVSAFERFERGEIEGRLLLAP